MTTSRASNIIVLAEIVCVSRREPVHLLDGSNNYVDRFSRLRSCSEACYCCTHRSSSTRLCSSQSLLLFSLLRCRSCGASSSSSHLTNRHTWRPFSLNSSQFSCGIVLCMRPACQNHGAWNSQFGIARTSSLRLGVPPCCQQDKSRSVAEERQVRS